MAVNQKPEGLRLGPHWRLLTWSVLDKSLPLVFGVAFLLLVVRELPAEEFGLQTLAGAMVLTVSQLLRSLLLVPTIKYVAEGRDVARVASTGAWLYVLCSAAGALVLAGGRSSWAGLFQKPALDAVLLPSACLLLAGSGRDAAISSLEGLRRLRAVFWLDAFYYTVAIGLLIVWRTSEAPRRADMVQWVQATAAAAGTLFTVTMARRYVLARPARAEAVRLARFGSLSFGSGLGATLSQQADTLLAGRLMDARGVAAYGTAKLLFRGFNVLAQSISQVVMPTVSRLHSTGRRTDLRVLFEKSVCFLHLGVVPACIGLVVLARPLLDLLFEGRYGDSVLPFQILVTSALTLPFASVGSPFLIGLGRVGTLLWITWAGVLLGLGLALLWIPRAGPVGAASALGVAAVFGMVARTVVLRRILGFRTAGIVSRWRDVLALVRRLPGTA